MPQASARDSVDHLLRYMPRDKSVVLAPLSLQETKKSGERRPMALAPAEMITVWWMRDAAAQHQNHDIHCRS